MSAHTPEPWHFRQEDCAIIGEHGRVIAKDDWETLGAGEVYRRIVVDHNALDGIKNPEAVGQAKAALEKIAAYWSGHTDEGDLDPTAYPWLTMVRASKLARETAEAALAALEGETP